MTEITYNEFWLKALSPVEFPDARQDSPEKALFKSGVSELKLKMNLRIAIKKQNIWRKRTYRMLESSTGTLWGDWAI